MNNKKIIFLDRDGTIIIDKIYLNDPDQIEYLPGVVEGLLSLRNLGYQFVIVTNQSGIARGLVKIENLYETHNRIRADLSSKGIDILGFYYAPYAVETNHYMRKPNPGMILTAAKDFNIDTDKSWMVGDKLSDVEAGNRAGTKSIYIEPGRPIEKITDNRQLGPYWVADNLVDVSKIISDAVSKD